MYIAEGTVLILNDAPGEIGPGKRKKKKKRKNKQEKPKKAEKLIF